MMHPVECKEVKHVGDGYLHESGDFKPYDVDGVTYCGKCHEYIPRPYKDIPPIDHNPPCEMTKSLIDYIDREIMTRL